MNTLQKASYSKLNHHSNEQNINANSCVVYVFQPISQQQIRTMGWKPTQQHDRSGMSHERENLRAQERILVGNNKRRNALAVCSLREDVLRQLSTLYRRDNQGNQRHWREDAEIDGNN